MQTDLYAAVIAQIGALVPGFKSLVRSLYQPPNSAVNMGEWPVINFFLAGSGGAAVTLTCLPEQYCQTDAVSPGVALFMLQEIPDPTQSSVLGLTLLTNYHTIFDRSVDGAGIVIFAQKTFR